MDLQEVWWKGVVDWIHSAQNSGKYVSYVNSVMNAGNFVKSGASQACCMTQCNRSKSFNFGCVQICKCVWLFYGEGEVGKHISGKNVHSETVV